MPIPLKEMLQRLPAEERKRVAKRAKQLIAKERSLRALRKELALTQELVAQRMGVEQEAVSRLEKQKRDLRLSTLENYIRALGGDLQLVAEFPDRDPVRLRDLAAIPRKAREAVANKKG